MKKNICVRCKKNKSTMDYCESVSDYAHGFIEKICKECFNKQKVESPLYQEVYNKALKDACSLFKNRKRFHHPKEQREQIINILESLIKKQKEQGK